MNFAQGPFRATKYLATTFSIIALVIYGFVVHASPIVTYNPGETLDPTDPNCQADNNCVVIIPGLTIGDNIGGGTPGQVLYTDVNGNLASDSLFSRASDQSSFNITSNLANSETGTFYQGDNMLGIGITGTGTFFKTAAPGVNLFAAFDATPFGGVANQTYAGYLNPSGDGSANLATLFNDTTGSAAVALEASSGDGTAITRLQLGSGNGGGAG